MQTLQKPPLLWTNVLVFGLTGLAAAILVPLYGMLVGYHWTAILACVLLLGYSGISITAGYHRLWAHRTYEAHPLLRLVFALGGALALQNSALHWSSDHRLHHRHVDDNERDPYSVGRGLWFAHIGWMLREYQASRYGDYSNVRDLHKDPIVMWQHRHYLTLTLMMNIGLPLLLGLLTGQLIGMLLLAGVLRLVVGHHFTFLINSAAHRWGAQPYTDDNTARDNGVLALLTYGEGYHNFHHRFEGDYRNGIHWWQFDPTKWLIRCCAWLGLTRKLRVTPEEQIERTRLQMQLKRIEPRLQRRPDREQLRQRLQLEYEQLLSRLKAYYAIRKRLLELKRRKLQRKVERSQLQRQYRELKQALTLQRKRWQQLLESTRTLSA